MCMRECVYVCVRVIEITCSTNLCVKNCETHHAIQARAPFFPQFGCFGWKVEFKDITLAKNNNITYKNITLCYSPVPEHSPCGSTPIYIERGRESSVTGVTLLASSRQLIRTIKSIYMYGGFFLICREIITTNFKNNVTRYARRIAEGNKSYARLSHMLKLHPPKPRCAKLSQTSSTFELFSHKHSFHLCCFENSKSTRLMSTCIRAIHICSILLLNF